VFWHGECVHPAAENRVGSDMMRTRVNIPNIIITIQRRTPHGWATSTTTTGRPRPIPSETRLYIIIITAYSNKIIKHNPNINVANTEPDWRHLQRPV